MTRRKETLAGVERALELLARYGTPDVPPHYLPPAPPAIEALIRTLERIK
jgi:hypothetical protein